MKVRILTPSPTSAREGLSHITGMAESTIRAVAIMPLSGILALRVLQKGPLLLGQENGSGPSRKG
jgi:hypothetical protein